MSRGRRLPKVLTEDEQRAMLDTFNARYRTPHRDRTMIETALATGLRAGEIVALKEEHVELDATGGRLMVREGKGAKDRVVYFGPEVRDALREWMDRDDRPDSEYVFCTRTGRSVSTSHLRRVVKRASRDAGVAEAERVSPHTLRHTFATDLYRETKNLRLVQKALGHASIQTTQIYTHVVDDEMESALREFRSDPEPEPVDDEGEPDLATILEDADDDEIRDVLLEELVATVDAETVRAVFMEAVA